MEGKRFLSDDGDTGQPAAKATMDFSRSIPLNVQRATEACRRSPRRREIGEEPLRDVRYGLARPRTVETQHHGEAGSPVCGYPDKYLLGEVSHEAETLADSKRRSTG